MKPLYVTLLFFFVAQIVLAQDNFLTISTGGGFAGTATVYKVSLDGKVLKGNGLGQISYTEESKVKKSTIKKCFRKAQALLLSTPNFNHPGNIYYSIAIIEKDKESKITWGDNEHPTPQEATELYQEIITMLSALNFNARSTH